MRSQYYKKWPKKKEKQKELKVWYHSSYEWHQVDGGGLALAKAVLPIFWAVFNLSRLFIR